MSSVSQIVHSVSQLILSSFRVSGRRVQILVAQKLSQSNQIVLVVFQKFVSHRVPKQMRMNLHADDGTVFVA